MIYKKFYAEVGKLLYAIASADGKVDEKEYKMLRNMVRNKLVPMESDMDVFGTDAAYYAEIEFDFLNEQMADPEPAFNSFIDYVEAYHQSFDSHLKEVCFRLSKEIAHAYYGINKKESSMLKVLKKEMDKLEKKNAT